MLKLGTLKISYVFKFILVLILSLFLDIAFFHWQPDSNREPLVSKRKSLTTKLRALNVSYYILSHKFYFSQNVETDTSGKFFFLLLCH